MADHADHHHHAAPAKPNASTMMGFALFLGVVAVLLALVAAIRGEGVLLDITGILGVAAIAVAVLAVIVGKAKGWPTRGFLAVLTMGAVALATWAVVGVWIGA